MNAEQLLEHFHKISDSPDAIPRLRKFILDLAVRGKLVEQDSNDEPARITVESFEGKLSTSDDFKECDIDGWVNVKLGRIIIDHKGGGTPSKSNSSYWSGDIPWASVKDIGKTKYLHHTIDQISDDGLKDSSSNLIAPNNLIIVTRMGLGKASINKIPVAINQDLRALFFPEQFSTEYVYIYFQTFAYEGTGLTVKGIKLNELMTTLVPLPPLAEQKRIVVKVEELMGLCDRLEAAQNQRETTRDQLVASSLHKLNTPEESPDEETFRNHARFYFNHLPKLTTKPEHIKQLRQTILNLAVRGKLVEQDPNDEPASELLEKARVVRENNFEKKLFKRGKRQQLVEYLEHDLDTPSNWITSPLDDLCHNITDGSHQTPTYVEEGRPFLSAKNVKPFRFMPDDHKFVSETDFENYRKGRKAEKGDVLVTRVGAGIGEAAVIDTEIEFAFYVSISLIKPIQGILDSEYLTCWINSPIGQSYAKGNTLGEGQSQGNLNLGLIRSFPITLPPVMEQKRIINKVNELLDLCDNLDNKVDSSIFINQILSSTLLTLN